jgi:riboflavin kinase/FMN adenylyltransferase
MTLRHRTAEDRQPTPLCIGRLPPREYFERSGSAVMTFGVFDGMHRGQIAIVQAVARRARRLGTKSVVIIFRPRPVDTLGLQPERPYFTALDETIDLIRQQGITNVGVLKFDRGLAETRAPEFLARLRLRLPFQELWLGSEASIGRGPEGSLKAIGALGASLDFRLRVFAAQSASSLGRTLGASFNSKDMQATADSLGRRYALPAFILPPVDRSASPWHHPVRTPRLLQVPPDGEYAVRVIPSSRSKSPKSCQPDDIAHTAALIIRTARGQYSQPSLLLVCDAVERDWSDSLVRLEFVQTLERPSAELLQQAVRFCLEDAVHVEEDAGNGLSV